MSTTNVTNRPHRGPAIPDRTWDKLRKQYQLGKGNCRQLAEKHGLNPQAVSTRCKREGWRVNTSKMTDRINQTVDRAINQKANDLADRAAGFVERSLAESEEWLDSVQKAKALVNAGDIDSLFKLVRAWRIPIGEGRKALGLDQSNFEQANSVVNVAIMSQIGPNNAWTSDGRTVQEALAEHHEREENECETLDIDPLA